MAARGLRAAVLRCQNHILSPAKNASSKPVQVLRCITTEQSGALLSRPKQVRFGLIKVSLTVTPFLLGGSLLSREFAAWLEEHELFVPDDDDDD